MKVRTLYLETSIFGFFFDETPLNAEKREAVRTLLRQITEGRFHGLVSVFVLGELRRGNPLQGLALVHETPLEAAEVDLDETEGLARGYIEEGILGEPHLEDARHIACASILNVDALVSLNLRHIANTWRVHGFNAVNLKRGYKPIIVATPQEVIEYGP